MEQKKKATSVYINAEVLEEFTRINKAYGVSNNAIINMLIVDYNAEKRKILMDNKDIKRNGD